MTLLLKIWKGSPKGCRDRYAEKEALCGSGTELCRKFCFRTEKQIRTSDVLYRGKDLERIKTDKLFFRCFRMHETDGQIQYKRITRSFRNAYTGTCTR